MALRVPDQWATGGGRSFSGSSNASTALLPKVLQRRLFGRPGAVDVASHLQGGSGDSGACPWVDWTDSLDAAARLRELKWEDATSPQKSIVHDMWDRHATMAAWGSINDGTAVLRRRRGADAPGYGRASATSRKRVNSTCIRKGDLCAMVASPVSVPPPGI